MHLHKTKTIKQESHCELDVIFKPRKTQLCINSIKWFDQ